MTLERLIQNLNLKQPLPWLVVGAISALGCESSVIIYLSENQGGGSPISRQVGVGGSEEVCIPNISTVCKDGNAYWQDSCGKFGEMYQLCSESQTCEKGQCVKKQPDCSMVTPTSGCQEQNCSFYDSFQNDLCKWNVITGSPYVSTEKLILEGEALVTVKDKLTLPASCNGDFIGEYKTQLLHPETSGSIKISHQNKYPSGGLNGLILTHLSNNENNKIILECNGYDMTVGDYDLHNQRRLKVQKIGSQLTLYVDNKLAGALTCNNTNNPAPVSDMYVYAGSFTATPQAMKVDDVTV